MANTSTKTVKNEIAVDFFEKRAKKQATHSHRLEAANAIRQDFENFSKEVYNVRRGGRDENGNYIAPARLSADEAVKLYYGAESLQDLLGVLGVQQYDNLDTIAKKLMQEPTFTLMNSDFLALLSSHTRFATASTASYNPEFRFLFPEIIANALDKGYRNAGMHLNWIGSTMQADTGQIVFPYINAGAGIPKIVNEGADIPLGSMSFDQKTIKTAKHALGAKFTYEILSRAPLYSIERSVAKTGRALALQADMVAMNVLINGDMAGGVESAPVVGVADVGSTKYRDLLRVFTRMRRLGHNPENMIAEEEEALDIALLPEVKGFSGETRLTSLSNFGIPEQIQKDVFTMPTGQLMVFDKNNALVKLEEGLPLIEQDKDISNQTVRAMVSVRLAFWIPERDARVVIDSSLDFATNGFPDFMDIDAYVSKFNA